VVTAARCKITRLARAVGGAKTRGSEQRDFARMNRRERTRAVARAGMTELKLRPPEDPWSVQSR